MEQSSEKNRRITWITVTIIFFGLAAVGILMVGGSIYYLDCQRKSKQVSCAISTKFLATFNTERREASNVTGVVERQNCDENNCQYRIELHTATGIEPLSNDYSPESKLAAITQIEAFFADSSLQTLNIQVVFWRMFIVSVVFSLLGAIGMVWCLFQYRKSRHVEHKDWPEVLLPGQGEAHERPDLLPSPDNLHMVKDPSGLHISYRRASWKGSIWLLGGVMMLGTGWLFLDPGESLLETILIFIFLVFGSGNADYESFRDPSSSIIIGGILAFFGAVLTYNGLAILINRLTIRVTYSELRVRHVPLPYPGNWRLPSKALKQLYITKREVITRRGTRTYGVLEAVLGDNRLVTLVGELPYNILRYLEVQIESWLGIPDRRVAGEVDNEGLNGKALQKKPGRVTPSTAIKAAVGTLIVPGFCLSVVIFTYLVELPWCPAELAQDSGLGDVYAIAGILYFPFAAALSGLLGYGIFRISRTLLNTANPMFLAITSGVLSGLVFVVIYPVLLTALLCMG